MIRRLLVPIIRRIALSSGRLSGLYRSLCQPDGTEWAQFLERHGNLNAIGKQCAIQTNVTITDPAYVRLGNNVRLSGCTLFGHDGAINMLRVATGRTLDRVGPIDIRDNVFIGHQAIVMPGVTIGPMSIVAAGAIVTRNVPGGMVVGGVPAKVIGTVDAYLARVEHATATLPWHDKLLQRPALAPSDATLDAQRIAHFFAVTEGEPA